MNTKLNGNMNIKEFYNKYKDWFLIILLILLSFKGCQSCSKNRQLEYKEIQYLFFKDSVMYIQDSLSNIIDSLNSELTIYKVQSETLKEFNNSLKETNSNLSRSNKNLSETNKNLTNKDTL